MIDIFAGVTGASFALLPRRGFCFFAEGYLIVGWF